MVAIRKLGEILAEDFGWSEVKIEEALAKQREKQAQLGTILRSIGPPDEVAQALGVQSQERRQGEEALRRITEESQGFTAVDIALMELTNAPVVGGSHDTLRVITTKSVYPWGVLIALVYDHLGLSPTDTEVSSAVTSAIQYNSTSLRALYLPAPDGRVGLNQVAARDLSKELMTQVCMGLGVNKQDCGGVVDRALQSSDQLANDLVKRGVLSDPITLLTASGMIAAMGFLPISITALTLPGERRYRRISALFWEFESWKSPYVSRVDVRFRVWKAVRILRRKLIEGAESFFDGIEELASDAIVTSENLPPPDPGGHGMLIPRPKRRS